MRLFYLSYKQVKQDFSLLCAYAIICGRFNITVNRDYLHAQNQSKLASVCLQRFLSIFETSIGLYGLKRSHWNSFSESRFGELFIYFIRVHAYYCYSKVYQSSILKEKFFSGRVKTPSKISQKLDEKK